MFGVVQRHLHRQGLRRRRAAADEHEPGPDRARSTRRSSTSSTSRAPHTATNTDGGAGVHRSQPRHNDWIQLNGPFNLFQIDSVTVRYADNAAGRTVGSPLGAIEVRTGSQTGPIVTTLNLTSTGRTRPVWNTPDVPDRRWRASTSCSSCSGRSRAGATGSMFLLNWAEFSGNGVTVQKVDRPGRRAAARCRPTLALSLGTPASFGAFTPGVARTYTSSMTANVISSAGDATLSVADPSPNATGRLVNGAFSLPTPVAVRAASAAGTGGAFAPVGGSAAPTTVLSYAAPVSNDAVTVSLPAGDRAPTMPCGRAPTARR